MSTTRPSIPAVSHLVLNVRDIDASHRFYTEMLGFVQCGQLKLPPGMDVDMRFYRGHGTHHHDIALAQMADPTSAPEVVRWQMFPAQAGIVHIALAYGSREEWLAQVEHLQANDVEFLVRGNHGMTHSVLHRRSRRQRHRSALRPSRRGVGGRRRRGAQLLRVPAANGR